MLTPLPFATKPEIPELSVTLEGLRRSTPSTTKEPVTESLKSHVLKFFRTVRDSAVDETYVNRSRLSTPPCHESAREACLVLPRLSVMATFPDTSAAARFPRTVKVNCSVEPDMKNDSPVHPLYPKICRMRLGVAASREGVRAVWHGCAEVVTQL